MSPRILPLAFAPVLLAASAGLRPTIRLWTPRRCPDEVLATQRGGFAFQGMVIAFGADIRSFVNDELALRTIVSWTPTGVLDRALRVAGADRGRRGADSGRHLDQRRHRTMRVGDEPVFLANNGQTAADPAHRRDPRMSRSTPPATSR